MGKIVVNGTDGQLGGFIADYIMENAGGYDNLVFAGYNEDALKRYEKVGIKTAKVDYSDFDSMVETFQDAETVLILSLPIVGEKRQQLQKNAVDACVKATVQRVVYTSYSGAHDPTNDAFVVIDHKFTEKLIAESGMKYKFIRDSQYQEAVVDTVMSTTYESGIWASNQGDGLVAYIAREDCGKGIGAAVLGAGIDNTGYTICGPELLTCTQCMEIASEVIGKEFKFVNLTDEALFLQFDEMGVPRTTEDMSNSPWPWCSEDMVSCGREVREGKMAIKTSDFEFLTGLKPLSMKENFQRKYGKGSELS